MHRTGAPRARQLAGVPARGRAVLYQRRAVRAEPGADGRQSGPGRKPGSGARGPGPAGRAGRLRPLRAGDARALSARAGRLQPVYACDRAKVDYAAASCQQLAGTCLDAHVAELLLAAIAPAALEVLLAAAEQVEAGRAEVDRIWRPRLERAEFAADRARRQYQLAEPENRLVVRQLERDWEAALAERERLGEEYARFTAARPRTLSTAERDQIRVLAADVPGIWQAPSTTDADRKQLIRALVEQVHVSVLGVSERVDVEVVWAGGHRTRTRIVRPVAKLTQLSYYPQLAARAGELVEAGHSTAQIAERLNAEGFRPPKRSAVFTPNAVVDLLRALGIHRATPARRSRPVLGKHEWWLRDLAGHLGMPAITLDAWVRRGWATGYLHPKARLIVVRADPAEVDRLRALHQLPQGAHPRRPWLRNQAALLNPDQEGAPGDAQPRL